MTHLIIISLIITVTMIFSTTIIAMHMIVKRLDSMNSIIRKTCGVVKLNSEIKDVDYIDNTNRLLECIREISVQEVALQFRTFSDIHDVTVISAESYKKFIAECAQNVYNALNHESMNDIDMLVTKKYLQKYIIDHITFVSKDFLEGKINS